MIEVILGEGACQDACLEGDYMQIEADNGRIFLQYVENECAEYFV